ncbi:MAG: polysaccharide deacetylase family protein [Firmicutes bacterium]|nr:polysaccharide deacetylase family protein [Bacillota bacterium]
MIHPEFVLRVGFFLGAVAIITFFYRRMLGKALQGLRRRQPRLLLFSLSLALALATLLLLSLIYVYHGFGYQPDIYRTGNRASGKVALTFDDGPSPEFTEPILDILKHYNVPATFFMVGSHAEKYPEIAARIGAEGHEIGSHTQSHRNIPTLSTVELHKELVEAAAVITEVTGIYPAYVRPPRGMYDDRFRRLAKLLGQEIVLWSISARDWRYGVSADYIIRFVERKVRGGDIILLHDSGALLSNEGGDRRATVLALPEVIETIWAKGLEIVPLSELLDDAPMEPFPEVDRPE